MTGLESPPHVHVPVRRAAARHGARGNPYAKGVSARGSFLRSAFGMTCAVDNGWVADEVELIIEFEARRD